MPEAIANAPELLEGLSFFYAAFWDVNTCRSLGFGAEGPIPWTAVRQWAEEHELEGDQRKDLFVYLEKMDGAYLKFVADRAAKRKSIAEAQGKRPGKGKRG